ncbi:MAG: hypothetical protein DRJ38_02245 [Thermoprotei archaeon]|nr:MAG: hypothetical protein DRJ38_02245 [Thermoprotei archaeon]
MYQIERIEKHQYEDIYTLSLSENKTKISVEIPAVLFEDLDIDPLKVSKAEVLVSGEKPDLELWDVVLRATVFDIKKEDDIETIYASAGGLQIRIRNPKSRELMKSEKIYIALKFKTRKA